MPYKTTEAKYANQARHRERNFQAMWELLSNSECADCGESDPVVLEFDHLPEYEKKFNISHAVSGSTRSWASIQSEIDKCEIVCSNCHRKRTAKRGLFKRHNAFRTGRTA